jgi:ATP-dependent Clp protease ATP-binding subunit ClpC
MRLLEDSLAEEILSGRIKDGDTALVDVDENGIVQVSSQQTRELLTQGVES